MGQPCEPDTRVSRDTKAAWEQAWQDLLRPGMLPKWSQVTLRPRHCGNSTVVGVGVGVGETQISEPRLSSVTEELNFTQGSTSQTCVLCSTYVKRTDQTREDPFQA